MAHIMLDIETLGTKPGCIIRSIGACVFAPGGSIPLGNTFYANVDRASCEAFGLVADPETEKWWEQQSEAAKAALTIDPRPLDDVLLDFEDWWRKNRGVEVWCHGATFDAPIVEAAYAAAFGGSKAPWDFWNVRCCRTVLALGNRRPDKYLDGDKHNALSDAKAQAMAVAATLRHGIKA